MEKRFTGIWPALVTPFHRGQVDHAGLRRLVRRFEAAGVSGLVVCGTTGEAASLNLRERLDVLDAVLACGSSLPLVMGLAGNHLGDVLAELGEIQARPVAGVLVPPPYYVRPSQQGIQAFYESIAQIASTAIILYNIPYRTGVPMTLETIRAIARHPAVRAIKDCGGDLALTAQLIADGRLDVLAGEDLQIFTTMCLGGAGAITAASHVRPDLFVNMADAIGAGDLAAARQIFHRLRPVIQTLFAEPNPGPVKAALAGLGLIDNELRSPMQKASPSLAHMLAAQLESLDSPASA